MTMEKSTQDPMEGHSRIFLEMAIRADHVGIPETPDARGKNTGACGDTIEMFLMVQNNHIRQVKFITDGCIATHACANAAAVMAEGKTIIDAWKITPEKLIDFLETLPDDSHHCAELAAGALYRALANHREVGQNAWKSLYRKSRTPG
jgi:nitrogen fixation protein NifU and related proteins